MTVPETSEQFGGHVPCNCASIWRPQISDWRSKEASEPAKNSIRIQSVPLNMLQYTVRICGIEIEKKSEEVLNTFSIPTL